MPDLSHRQRRLSALVCAADESPFLNGPNLNLLGKRTGNLRTKPLPADMKLKLGREAVKLGVEVEFRQSKLRGELVEWIQQAKPQFPGHRAQRRCLYPYEHCPEGCNYRR